MIDVELCKSEKIMRMHSTSIKRRKRKMPNITEIELDPLKQMCIDCLKNIRKRGEFLTSTKADTVIRNLRKDYQLYYHQKL